MLPGSHPMGEASNLIGGRGALDSRADVFRMVVEWVVWLACFGLLAFFLENVEGCNINRSGQGSFMERVKSALEAVLPDFAFDIITLKASDYMLAQNRTRVFLRGLRKTCCPDRATIPSAMPPLGPRPLKDFLNMCLPNTDVKTLAPQLQKNLKDMEKKLKTDFKEGKVTEDSIVCFSIDRKADNVAFKTYYLKDV
eukprot:1625788-Pyramimonas_sp.AAC.1